MPPIMRVWSRKLKKMIYAGDPIDDALTKPYDYLKSFNEFLPVIELLVGLDEAIVAVNELDHAAWLPSRDFVVMLYTGARDVHGIPIYERDIVRVTLPSTGELVYGVVGYVPKETAFLVLGRETRVSLGTLTSKKDFKVEVVGSVYETPELMKMCE